LPAPEINYLPAAVVNCTGGTLFTTFNEVAYEFTTHFVKFGGHDALDEGRLIRVSRHRVSFSLCGVVSGRPDSPNVSGILPADCSKSNAEIGRRYATRKLRTFVGWIAVMCAWAVTFLRSPPD
jgi:hypothetical protein